MEQNIVEFLRKIADSVENKTVDEKSLEILIECYMKYKNSYNLEEKDEEEIKKYLFMGWYIYDIILKEKYPPN